MTFDELLEKYPRLAQCTKGMPEHLKTNFTLRCYPPHSIIHQKDEQLQSFGIVCQGRHRVLNEFEDGNIFMIEKNTAISFVGEVALLAGEKTSSVTIETITECYVLFIPLESFEEWIRSDNNFLCMLTRHIAKKLYTSSYVQGERQYYSVTYLVAKYLLEQYPANLVQEKSRMVLRHTRRQIGEELGLTVKTLNRAVARLRKDELLEIERGKIVVNTQQHERLAEAVKTKMQTAGD